jgi:hypothetical protein
MAKYDLIAELKTLLTTHSGFTWGIGEKPSGAAGQYGILYDIVTVPGGGAFNPESNLWTAVQTTLVGISHEQVTWMSGKVQTVLIGRSNGVYIRALSNCIGRGLMQQGPVVRSNDDIYFANDQYRFLLEG